MPANLTPEYLEAEAKFKQAKTIPDKIKALEVMLAVIPKHKGTEKMRAQLRSRMAKLKEELRRKPMISRAEQAFNIKKEGAGQVILLGLPNVGKSSLFSKVTNAPSEIGDYPFTTQKPIPGMMRFENIQIQLVDTPPLQLDHIEPGFPNLIRNGDALLLVLDLGDDSLFQMEVLIEILNEMKIKMIGREQVSPPEGGWVCKKSLLIGNKCDLSEGMKEYKKLEEQFNGIFPLLPISTRGEMNLEEMKKEIYLLLDIIRVYTKAPGKEPDFTEPVILKKGSTVEDVALSIHKDFAQKLRYARIWGSGKFGGQMVKRDFPVQEGDVVELHI